jgi:hypothetical protein
VQKKPSLDLRDYSQNGRKSLPVIHVIKELYTESIGCAKSQHPKIQQPNEEMGIWIEYGIFKESGTMANKAWRSAPLPWHKKMQIKIH